MILLKNGWLVSALVLAAGCSQILGIDQEGPSAWIDAALPPDSALPDAAPPDADLSFACGDTLNVGEAVTFDTTLLSDNEALSCASGDSGEEHYVWSSPTGGYYRITTEGSSFDTALGVQSRCEGEEVACNNDRGGNTAAEIVRKFSQDEEVVFMVEGANGQSGAGQLLIEKVLCPSGDLDELELPTEYDLVGDSDDYSNACGGEGGKDRAFHWQAPEDGLYAFTASVSGGPSPIISLHKGGLCSDPELGCHSPRIVRQNGRSPAEMVRRFSEGELVSVHLDTKVNANPSDPTGAIFSLDVQKRDLSCPEVQMSELSLGKPQTLAYTQRRLSPSCNDPMLFAFAEPPGSEVEHKDFSIGIPVMSDGSFTVECTYTVTSQAPFTLSLMEESDCSGAELECKFGEGPIDGPVSASYIISGEAAERAYTLVVSQAERLLLSDEFVLSVGCRAM